MRLKPNHLNFGAALHAPKSMTRPLYLLGLFFGGLFLATLWPSNQAHAEFRVCNDTANLVGVAVGYRGEEGWISEGWWQLPATTCATVVPGPLQSRYYYLYAEDASGSGRWTGYTNMCVAEEEFEITGVQDCFTRGYQQMGFSEYDTGREESWTVQLSSRPSTQESQN
ncbi:DUF1036 domain-containing protein [Martelella lutilitoris]|uniref:DUF1036 domain-containing protein n=2 Tax=Martelella lutilitoris TaxID=2583532 RepID=A0A5C4JLC3_9HYPH|nr:DUF1036 domain-containing protein [Martelella lutilitoris]